MRHNKLVHLSQLVLLNWIHYCSHMTVFVSPMYYHVTQLISWIWVCAILETLEQRCWLNITQRRTSLAMYYKNWTLLIIISLWLDWVMLWRLWWKVSPTINCWYTVWCLCVSELTTPHWAVCVCNVYCYHYR